MNLFPVQSGSTKTYSSLTIPTSSTKYGTHFSHFGIGGYTEVPTIGHRNSIPIGLEMNTDGFSCGRRKFGMVVYVVDEGKFYQLAPKHSATSGGIAGSPVTLADWSASTNAQRMVWLDPTKKREDNDGSAPTYNLVIGSGNADDAWLDITPVFQKTSITFISGGPYFFEKKDESNMLLFNSVSALTAYVPDDSVANFNIGASINFATIASTVYVAGSGVNVRAADNRNYLRTTNSAATILKIAPNDWLLFGDIWSDTL